MSKQELISLCCKIVPKLTKTAHKGSHGRIGVIGGSFEYTGGPYYAAISALKTGCDLVHVFCCKAAGPVIKSYSPALIVHPLLDMDNAIRDIVAWLPKLHALVVGPGLGRNEDVLETIRAIFDHYKSGSLTPIPIIIDADGLYLVMREPTLFKGYSGPVFLTPNKNEYLRFCEVLGQKDATPSAISNWTGTIIVQKGETDVITNATGDVVAVCEEEGSLRRCGGQGDVLAGTMATFAAWQHMNPENHSMGFSMSAYAASLLTRRCSKMAYQRYKRSMVADNLIKFIQYAFEDLFESHRQ